MGKNRLLAEAEKIELSITSKPRWYERLREQDSKCFDELLEFCHDFHGGGVAFRKFRNCAAVHRYLVAQNAFGSMTVGYAVFRAWFTELGDGQKK